MSDRFLKYAKQNIEKNFNPKMCRVLSQGTKQNIYKRKINGKLYFLKIALLKTLYENKKTSCRLDYIFKTQYRALYPEYEDV